MTSVLTSSPEAAYLTKPNIVVGKHVSAAKLAAETARAQAEIGLRFGGVTVSGGSISQAVA